MLFLFLMKEKKRKDEKNMVETKKEMRHKIMHYDQTENLIMDAQADWDETDEDSPAYIQNKPNPFFSKTLYFVGSDNYLYPYYGSSGVISLDSRNKVTYTELSNNFLKGGVVVPIVANGEFTEHYSLGTTTVGFSDILAIYPEFSDSSENAEIMVTAYMTGSASGGKIFTKQISFEE